MIRDTNLPSLNQLAPNSLWRHFEALCAIPHPSKHEAAVVAHIVSWAKSRQLQAEVDEVGNVILKKPASQGMEERPGVILQSHLDMVPQKNRESDHDFEKDPIRPSVDGEYVIADGTTLGADNGIGVAAILALFESDSITHPPLEALLTIDEEAGMSGAMGLHPGRLKGELLLNLDTEEEGEIYVGCAGGVDVSAELPIQREPLPANFTCLQLTVAGLQGGHSGCDIHLGRGNANKITSRFLQQCLRDVTLRVAEFDGGSLRNAIPREASTTLAVADSDLEQFQSALADYQKTLHKELGDVESTLGISAKPCDAPATVLTPGALHKVLQAMQGCPNGVERMSTHFDGVVETSNNLARVESRDECVVIRCLVRSLLNSTRDNHAEAVASVFRLAGSDVAITHPYPGWRPDQDSQLLAHLKTRYRELFEKEPAVNVIHAGLECGVLGATYPNWEMISFGPTIEYAHSPDERVHIASVDKFWTLLLDTLATL